MRITALLVALSLLASCTPAQPRNTGVYMLVDTSGTYRQEIEKAEQIIRYALTRLHEKDSFAVARIDTGSFSEKDIVAKVTFATMSFSLKLPVSIRATANESFSCSRFNA